MALAVGARLGPYEVVAAIGQGGMGEVYRARDTELKRDVALKVLPDALTTDPDRLARFQREAEVLAALNHPHIAQIYGLEHADLSTPGASGAGQVGVALVMELVDGDDLSQRITRGPIPLDEALSIARQIAEALEAAHEAGIVHRDLKPANIKVRDDGTVKVLDFGLAKAVQDPRTSRPQDLVNSPTITSPAGLTVGGMILGTAAYMAPEQAKGRPVDRRADIWAFGCLLYEMLTGRRAFPGEDVGETLAAVIRGEPDWAALPAGVPPGVEAYLRRCFEKDPKQRVQSMGDVRLALAGAFELPAPVTSRPGPTGATRVPSRWLMAAVGLVGLMAGVSLVTLALWNRASQDEARVVRFSIPLEGDNEATASRADVAISADGRHMAYRAGAGQARALYVRPLDGLKAISIRDTTGATNPFFSPDGQWIGFWQEGRLVKTSVGRSGTPVVLSDVASPFGASWGADDTILVGQGSAGIWRVPGAGGRAERVIALEPGESAHGPQPLPDGEWVLYTLRPRGVGSWNRAQIVVQSLASHERRVVVERGRDARYLTTGHLVFGLDGGLVGAPFDARSHRITAPAVPLVDDVAMAAGVASGGHVQFAVSRDGTLVYVPSAGRMDRSLVWVNRDGTEAPVPLPRRDYGVVRISPDGTRAAMSMFDGASWNIWVAELDRETLVPLANSESDEISPLWTRDGRSVVFASEQDGAWAFFRRAAGGTGSPDRLIAFTEEVMNPSPGAWTPDGARLVFEYDSRTTGSFDIGVVTLDDAPAWAPLVHGEHEEGAPTLSPDGRLIAYTSTEGGRRQVWLQRFPELGDRRLVSAGRGMDPVWSPDGRTLFFRAGETAPPTQMTAVSLAFDPVLSIGRPTILFDKEYYRSPVPLRFHDRSPADGRFLMPSADEARADSWSIVVVQQWLAEFDARLRRQ